ncbi:MAG: hypothetical protein Q8Q12_06740 [bacterium]|nr:hypothetical protein [bacterium]
MVSLVVYCQSLFVLLTVNPRAAGERRPFGDRRTDGGDGNGVTGDRVALESYHSFGLVWCFVQRQNRDYRTLIEKRMARRRRWAMPPSRRSVWARWGTWMIVYGVITDGEGNR